MIDNVISKVYLARVRGDFRKVAGIKDNELVVKNMIYCVSNLDAFWQCSEADKVPFEHETKAKEAETKFVFKFYDEASDMSVLKCYPVTGRTHQIRVHLQYLGYPIANDQMYGYERNDKGQITGPHPIILNDGRKPLDDELFANSYENKDVEGKKQFMSLWLHAYRYIIPPEIHGGDIDEPLKVKSRKPDWATPEFNFKPWMLEDEENGNEKDEKAEEPVPQSEENKELNGHEDEEAEDVEPPKKRQKID